MYVTPRRWHSRHAYRALLRSPLLLMAAFTAGGRNSTSTKSNHCLLRQLLPLTHAFSVESGSRRNCAAYRRVTTSMSHRLTASPRTVAASRCAALCRDSISRTTVNRPGSLNIPRCTARARSSVSTSYSFGLRTVMLRSKNSGLYMSLIRASRSTVSVPCVKKSVICTIRSGAAPFTGTAPCDAPGWCCSRFDRYSCRCWSVLTCAGGAALRGAAAACAAAPGATRDACSARARCASFRVCSARRCRHSYTLVRSTALSESESSSFRTASRSALTGIRPRSASMVFFCCL